MKPKVLEELKLPRLIVTEQAAQFSALLADLPELVPGLSRALRAAPRSPSHYLQ
jgi:hypothetical protein